MILSLQQEAVVQWVQEGTGHLNIIARAGTGKTTTLIEITKVMKGDVYLGAYNKAIADEISARLPKRFGGPRVQASTLHSAGMKAWRAAYPHCTVDGRKLGRIVNDLFTGPTQWKREVYGGFVRKLVSFAKQWGFGFIKDAEDLSNWEELMDHFGVYPERAAKLEEALEYSQQVFQQSLDACPEVIDFDDMLLAPLVFHTPVTQYDWVLIDEAQDTNPVRRELALKMLKKTGRFVAVGDPGQAIYGFTGADAASLDHIKKQLGSKELPLTVTYRCPTKIVKLANTWVPDLEAVPGAPEGEVIYLPVEEFNPAKTGDNKAAILCRNVAPLVGIANDCLIKQVPFSFECADIKDDLLRILSKWKDRDMAGIKSGLQDWKEKEMAFWAARQKWSQVDKIEDRARTLHILIEQVDGVGGRDVQAVERHINRLLIDRQTYGSKPGGSFLTITTIHRSKGREWDTVYLVGRDRLQPSKWARMPWELEQEKNLCYVGVTRAKKRLVEINLGEEDKR